MRCATAPFRPFSFGRGPPPRVPKGTNRWPIITQNGGAVRSFHKRKLITREWLLLGAPPSVVGALVGTVAAVQIGDLAFQRVLAFMMVALTAWTLWRPLPAVSDAAGSVPTGGRRLAFAFVFFLVGFYGGGI